MSEQLQIPLSHQTRNYSEVVIIYAGCKGTPVKRDFKSLPSRFSFYNIALSGPKITAYFFKSAVHRRFTIHTAIRQIHHFTDKFHVRHSAVRLVFPYRPKGPAALFFTPPVSRLHQIKAAFFFFRTKQTCFGLIQQAFIGLSLTIGHCPAGSK